MIPVIISGGSGTRLWPVSRSKFPKQFSYLFDHSHPSNPDSVSADSLFNKTLARCKSLGQARVVTTQNLRDLTNKKMREMDVDPSTSLFEPLARNTAPAIAWLCHSLMVEGKNNEIVAVFPADHLVKKPEVFEKAIGLAEKLALQNKIVVLGITPDHPATGYGYIQTHGNSLNSSLKKTADLSAFPVEKFHEKPDLKTAESFLQKGGFHWNAGIFVFQVKVMSEHFARLQPEMWKQVQEIKADNSNLTAVYQRLASISIDYAIIEKLRSEELACIPVDFGWSDVGSWDAMAEIQGDSHNNKNVYQVESKNNYVFPHMQKNYALLGVEDLIVVDTADSILITKKGKSQDVRKIVDLITKDKARSTEEHVFEERPWGKYEILRDTETFKSKVIQVLPGAQLSYQSHEQRAEHWIITAGEGEVVLDEKVIPVKYGSYVFIPTQTKHRMRNTGTTTLEFVEVQVGSYFGEDDIKRYQDDYKRS